MSAAAAVNVRSCLRLVTTVCDGTKCGGPHAGSVFSWTAVSRGFASLTQEGGETNGGVT